MDKFNQRKKDVLSKEDKSSIGEWDGKIKDLCEKINSLEDYYTTSSCSGRVVLVRDEERKGPGVFEFVSHDLVNFGDFILKVEEMKKDDYKFKQEPFILHVACRDLECAEKLLGIANESGLRRAGIIALGKNIVVELNGSEKLEFPLVRKGNLLVLEDFLKLVLEKSNENLKKSWEKIEKLKRLV